MQTAVTSPGCTVDIPLVLGSVSFILSEALSLSWWVKDGDAISMEQATVSTSALLPPYWHSTWFYCPFKVLVFTYLMVLKIQGLEWSTKPDWETVDELEHRGEVLAVAWLIGSPALHST